MDMELVNREFKRIMTEEMKQFRAVVKTAKEPLKYVFDREFFESVESDVDEICKDGYYGFEPSYFVFRWLSELQAFSRINDSLNTTYENPKYKN